MTQEGTEPVIPEREPQDPTTEERLETLTAQLTQAQAEKAKAEESYKGLQRTVNEKDSQIKKQGDLDSRIGLLTDRIDLIATAIASGAGSVDDMAGVPTEARNSMLAQLEALKADEKRKQEETEKRTRDEESLNTVRSYQGRVESLGLTIEDDAYMQVYDLVTSGDPLKMQRADIILNKLEKEKVPDEKKETDMETKAEARAQELLRQEMEKRGLLKNDNSTPSAPSGGLTREDLEKMTPAERRERSAEIAKMPLG